jgi:FdhE protein
MKPSVISKEYLALQTDISNKQIQWANKLEASSVIESQHLQQKQVPIITQVDVKIDYVKYKEWLIELADFLVEKDGNLLNDVTKLKEKLDSDVVKRWADEALAFNQLYFQSFSEEMNVQPWLPYLLAEHCLRPFLRIVSEVFKDDLPNQETKGSCPCCGEPIRLAVLEGKGKKMMVCPRCEAKWQQKRLRCSFCGNEDHQKLSYYTVEKDPSSKIEVCSECNNYTKVIDTRKLFKKQTTFLLDVNSIHLDIVAQENGFGISKEEVNN